METSDICITSLGYLLRATSASQPGWVAHRAWGAPAVLSLIALTPISILLRIGASYAVAVGDVAVVPLDDFVPDEYDRVGHVGERNAAAALDAPSFIVKARFSHHIVGRGFLPQRVEGSVDAGRRA
jgi:hypothetical protein